MKLLISVTTAIEAQAALEGGADIIDIKNPAEGALGAAPLEALREVCALVAGARPVSAALGDSLPVPGVLALAAYGAASFGVDYVKIALSRPNPDEAINLLGQLQASLRQANPTCKLIAVGYADAAEVGALDWRRLPQVARAAGIDGCLIDTAQKDGRGLFNHCAEAELARWLAECRQAGLLCALAGSLKPADMPAMRDLAPDIAGFRGAACRGDRVNGRVEAALVAALRAACHHEN